MHTMRFAALLGLMAMLVFTNTGCFSILGVTIGGIVDGARSDRFRDGPGWQLENVKSGTPITLTLQDSSRLNGVFTGVEQQSAAAYAQRYHAWRAQPEGAAFPALGDQITLIYSSGKRSAYEFQGFDYQEVWPSYKPSLCILGKHPGRLKPQAVELEQTGQIVDSQGTVFEVETLKRQFLEGLLPLSSVIRFRLEAWVAIEQVVSLSTPGEKQGKQTNPGIKVLIDALKPGTPVTLGLQDSTQLTGVFVGMEQQPVEVYARRYTAWRGQPEGAAFPALGAQITLIRSSGKQSTYEFQGFDYRQVWSMPVGRPYILVRRSSHGKLETVKVEQVSEIVDSGETSLTADEINRLFLKGRLPLWSAMVIRQEDSARVAIDQVALITSSVKKRGVVYGAAIGAIPDGLLLLFVLGLALSGGIGL